MTSLKQVAVSSLPMQNGGESAGRQCRVLIFCLLCFLLFRLFHASAETGCWHPFQSVTPDRLRGKSFHDVRCITGRNNLLMLIGGSPGSTAGGMKTTTLAVLLANLQPSASAICQFFGRSITLRQDRRDHSDDVLDAVLWRCCLYRRI